MGDQIKFVYVILTSETCGICTLWKTSGELDKFMKMFPDAICYHIDPMKSPPNIEETQRRHAVAGIGVPTVIAVLEDTWKNPLQMTRRDILICPGYVRSPQGIELFKKWRGCIINENFLGYLLLETSGACGHCKKWKESGDMDDFLKEFSLLEIEKKLLLCHNSIKPPSVRIGAVPTIWFVSSQEWSSYVPQLIQGPPVQNREAVRMWIKKIQESGNWYNDPSFIPNEIRGSTTTSKAGAVENRFPQRAKRQLLF